MPNFTSFLDSNARFYGGKEAMVDPKRGVGYTYKELHEVVNRVASGLRRLGVKFGDRVCVGTGNRPETVICYFAAWRVGAIAVPVNPSFKPPELAYIIMDSEPKAFIASREVYGSLSKVKEASSLDVVVVLEGEAEGAIPWSQLVEMGSPFIRPANCSLDDLCQIQYTAGTTGVPKGAMLTHGNWMAAVEAERWVLRLTDRDVYLGFYPHFHVGISWGITALRYGATFIVMERFKLDEYLKLAEHYKATVLSGMPPVLYSLVQAPPRAEDSLRSARCIITGGAPTPQEVWRKFVERYPHIEVVNAYGLSETIVVGTATAVPVGFPELSKGFMSVGAPIGYCEVKIVDENDPSRELPPGEVGEIALRGPSVAKGYWRKPKETERVFLSDGWFLTGDVGYLDEDGVLYITGRKKDVIIMSGWKIYPAEVENVLVKHPKVAEAAVFAKYDERRGEVPAAAVVLKPSVEATPEEIIEFCRERLASYKVPRYVVFLESLPKMGGWKVLHRVLREKYGGFPKEELAQVKR
ncbi:MAG: acyl-CoA synthetase [Thermoprotei archaeon]|nr:MAG: acyl-CoA synthetase [Thermoprotei archaeon]